MAQIRQTYGNKTYYLLLIWYMLSYFYDCVNAQYLQKYMKACGLATSEIGTIISVGTIFSIIAQLLWARAADKARYKNTILLICSIGSAVIGLLWLRVPAEIVFVYVFAITLISTVFRSAVLMLSDTICLEILEKDNRPFGPVRLMGAIGWAVMGFIAGQILDRDIFLFGPLCMVLAAITIGAHFFVPKIKGHREKARLDIKGFFKNPKILPLIIYIALTSLGNGVANTYFYLNFEQLGGNTSSYGTYLLIVTLTEIPFLFFADRILRRFGVRITLATVGIISSLRLLYIYFVPSYKWLFGLALANGILVIGSFVISIFFNRIATADMKTTSLTIATVTQGIFRSIGAYAGGLIINHVFNDNFQPAYLISAGMVFIAVVFLLISTAKVKFDTP